MLIKSPPLASLALVALAFLATAAFAMKTFGTNTPVWYANAVVLVALLKHPRATWPVFLGVVWITDMFAIRAFGDGGPAALLALCDLGEIALAAALIDRAGGIKAPVFSGPQGVRVVSACLLVPILSSGAGAALLWSFEGAPFLASWRIWYSASALGLVLVAPFLLIWSDPNLRKQASEALTPGKTAVLIAASLLAAFLVGQDLHHPLLFLSFPAVLIMTWTFGILGTTVGVLAVSAAALWATLNGQGPLVGLVLPIVAVEHRVEAVQLYLAAVLFSSLPLAILMRQQRELASDLRRVGEARTEFLAAMSHEIRTPMTAVLGMVDLMRSEDLSPTHKSYVESMRTSGRHLMNVINDILDFSRIETGKLELEQIDFSLPDLLERLRSVTHPLAAERRLDLHIELSPHSPLTLRGDPTRVKQVLLNLVSNAIKFTETGGVTLTASQLQTAGDEVRFRFEVRDTGPGIPPERLQGLFAPFTQADSSTARRYGGTGLGLAISKRLVEAMGGKIGATSSPGLGSIFYFEVPLQLGDPLNLVRRSFVGRMPVQPRKILVAEDVEINRVILKSALAKRGHELVFAEDGAQALELVQRQAFDLVLMDVQMPVMDGVEATRRIRNLPGAQRSIPILGLTANVMARERERYIGAGMNECLMKPIEWDQLEAAIARHGHRADGFSFLLPAHSSGGRPACALLDLQALGGLRNTIDPQEFASIVAAGIDAYEGYAQAMRSCQRSGCRRAGGAQDEGLGGQPGISRYRRTGRTDRVCGRARLAGG
ncbi:MAG: response regulator [Ramlibacter sp.]|nr:response regulator [Ramlibacter sp.]